VYKFKSYVVRYTFCSTNKLLILQVRSVLSVIGSLEEHLESDKEDADIMQSNAHEDTLFTTSTKRRTKRTRATTSSVQAFTRSSPPDTYPLNAPRRNKKRAKRSPLPMIVQPASAPRRSARRNGRSHIAAAQAASARREESDPVTITEKSPRTRNTRSRTTTAQLLGGKEITEEETDNNLQVIDQQESTLDVDYDDQCGEGEKGTTSNLLASKRSYKTFDERFEALMSFKDAFGHCDAPETKSSQYYSLGHWCSNLRASYKQIQKGKTPRSTLTDDHIRRLDEAGFKWSQIKSFDAHFEEMMKFKEKFGHCNAPQTKSSEYYSLAIWCHTLRVSYKQIQKGENPRNKLPADEHIRRLEEVGFKWITGAPRKTFDDRLEELVKFKQKFGHCNAPRTKSSEYYPLGKWCSNLRMSYNQIQKGKKPRSTLRDDHIRRLEEVGFKWQLNHVLQL